MECREKTVVALLLPMLKLLQLFFFNYKVILKGVDPDA